GADPAGIVAHREDDVGVAGVDDEKHGKDPGFLTSVQMAGWRKVSQPARLFTRDLSERHASVDIPRVARDGGNAVLRPGPTFRTCSDPVCPSPPNRRSRRRKDVSASAKSPSLKSGHIRSVKCSSA